MDDIYATSSRSEGDMDDIYATSSRLEDNMDDIYTFCAFYPSNHLMDDEWKRHSIMVDLQSSKEVDKWLVSNSNIGVELLFAEYQVSSAYGAGVVYVLECTEEVWKRMLKELNLKFME